MESALHRGQRAVCGKQFDGIDAASFHRYRERQTGQPRLIVNQYRAGATFAAVAARFRAGQSNDFP